MRQATHSRPTYAYESTHAHTHTHAHQGSMARTSTKVIKAIRYCRALASVAVRQSKARPGVRPYAKYTSRGAGDTLTHPPHDFKPIKPLTTTTARTASREWKSWPEQELRHMSKNLRMSQLTPLTVIFQPPPGIYTSTPTPTTWGTLMHPSVRFKTFPLPVAQSHQPDICVCVCVCLYRMLAS